MARRKLVLITITAAIAFLGGILTGCGTTGDASTAAAPPPPPPPPPGLNVSPTNWSFGQVAVGSSDSKSVTLSNIGNTTVSISAANVSGSGYTVSGITFPKSVVAGASTTATINFGPSAPGSSTGSVSFVSDASNSPTVISLSGSGFTPGAHAVDLSWNASTSVVDGYRVYRSTVSGSGYQRISASMIPGTTFTDNSVVSGQTFF